MAPRSKLTPASQAAFVQHIRNGLWRDDAARLCGIGSRTIDLWISKGRKSFAKAAAAEAAGEPYTPDRWARFLVDLEAAESEVADELIGVVVAIARNGESDDVRLRAATWFLARKDNLRYGSGSQRTDLRGAAPTGDDEDVVDPGAFVLEALSKFVEAKAIAAQADDGPTGE